MRVPMTSIFHQPILSVHIMSHQNSVFVAFIDQHSNPAEVKSRPVSERFSLCNGTEPSSIYIFHIPAGLYDNQIHLFLGTRKT
uniref:Uncharacterized protein n=1 Tax=Calidris pygmaea TaxID=425635 RepID=A0A8C3K2Q3_9CHAR